MVIKPSIAFPTRSPLISKSTYLQGLQCPKLLWHRYNAKEEFPLTDDASQAIFDQGHEVGNLAKLLFPTGIEIAGDTRNFAGLIAATKQALLQRKPIFEATFLHESAFARADILNPVGIDEWELIEVKSSTKQKDIHLHDLAFQTHALGGAGLKIQRAILLLVDNSYVRKGVVDPSRLFVRIDATKDVEPLLADVPANLGKMLKIIAMPTCPEVRIGPHCSKPFACPLESKCWALLPEHSVFTLIRGGSKSHKLFRSGTIDLKSLPDSVKLTETQQRQVQSLKAGTAFLDKSAVKSFLDRLTSPIHFLDFETIAPAVPLFANSRPYQQIPFQYSLHLLDVHEEKASHRFYLRDQQGDPRNEFLLNLLANVAPTGSIVTYNATFEKTRLKELGDLFPEHRKSINSIHRRICDLYDLFRSFSYYHPQQKGEASIKALLPILTGKAYANLEIQNGGMASREFLRLLSMRPEDPAREALRQQLLEYCELDTEGMLLICAALRRKISESPAKTA